MHFEHLYIPDSRFRNRYLSPENLFDFLHNYYPEQIVEIGRSFNNLPVYKFTFGKGNIKIIAWSQMHGNESNATLAMLDLLHTLEKNELIKRNLESEITFDFIFMLNPDGSKIWTRLNAQEIDLNRDFFKNESKELDFLKLQIAQGNYQYALNLHEQRTIFSTDCKHPATLSFLAPSENIEREITKNRKICMAVISEVYSKMKDILPHRIARYTDEFYPTSTGDNFMKAGLPTILFEGGHYENDYYRKETRKFYTVGLFYALEAAADLKGNTDGWERYLEIPENQETHYDLIYRNVTLNTDHPCTLDIAVQYREIYEDGNEEISFVPYVIAVGDVKEKKGWKEIDCTAKKMISKTKYPKIDEPVNFSFE